MDRPLKGKIRNAKVFVRLFPSENISWDLVKIGKDKKSICCRCLQDFGKNKDHKAQQNFWRFSTDGVFYNCSQKEVYSKVTSGVIESVFKGHNVIIAAYGQTGSGKSLTTLGLYNSEQDRGIAPRTIVDLFSYLRLKHGFKVSVLMSCLEIANTRFIDLFDPELNQRDQSAIKSVTRMLVKNENEALSTLYKVEGRRQFLDKSNYESHKANFIMTLNVIVERGHRKTSSKLHIIDLAGADNYGNISCSYKELFDVANGNLAKSQLEQFLLLLCENIPIHILSKQRLNTLIYYLKDSLTNDSMLRFIGHIRTNAKYQTLTISMLRFAQIIKCLPPMVLATNVVETEGFLLNTLQQQVQDLERRALIQSMVLNTDLAREITQQRIIHMQHVAKDYLQDATNELTILDVADVVTFLKIFKDMYNNLRIAKEKQHNEIHEKVSIDTPEQLPRTESGKVIRKRSQKSRESATLRSSIHSQTKPIEKEAAIEQKQPSTHSTKHLQRGSLPNSQTHMKTIKSNTSKGSRRKSSNMSVEVIKEESYFIIPEEPHSYAEAYNLFVNSTEYDYNKLSEINRACTVAADAANKEYIEEVKNLRELNEMLEKRKYEHLQAKMQKEFLADPVASNTEYTSMQKVIEAELMVVAQEETVLKYQTDLKIALDNYHRSKKCLSDEFDRFCMDKFKTLIPVMAEEEVEQEVEQKKNEFSKVEEGHESALQPIPKQQITLLKHKELQQIMAAERKLTAAKKKEKGRKWIM